jgi:hypothetical protein
MLMTDNNQKIFYVEEYTTPQITSGKTKLACSVRGAKSNSIPYVCLRTQYNSQDERLNACSLACVQQIGWPTLCPLCRFYADVYHTSHADRCAYHQVGHHADNINYTYCHRMVHPNIKHRHGIWKFNEEPICYWRLVRVYVTRHIACRRLARSIGASVFPEAISALIFLKRTR